MIASVLYRDLKSVSESYRLWFGLALCVLLLGLLLLSMLDDYVLIQAQLQANNINRGVVDLVVVPYVRISGYTGSIVALMLASRLFYAECFSPYAAFFHSTQPSTNRLWVAKSLWVGVMSLLLVSVILLPLLLLRWAVAFDVRAMYLSALSLFYLFSWVGFLSACLSKHLNSGAVVSMVVIFYLLGIEFLAKIIVEPIWLQSIVFYLSPVKHFGELLEGRLFISTIVFYFMSLVLCFCLTKRSFEKDRFVLS